jgi:hypothetical protein
MSVRTATGWVVFGCPSSRRKGCIEMTTNPSLLSAVPEEVEDTADIAVAADQDATESLQGAVGVALTFG